MSLHVRSDCSRMIQASCHAGSRIALQRLLAALSASADSSLHDCSCTMQAPCHAGNEDYNAEAPGCTLSKRRLQPANADQQLEQCLHEFVRIKSVGVKKHRSMGTPNLCFLLKCVVVLKWKRMDCRTHSLHLRFTAFGGCVCMRDGTFSPGWEDLLRE
eukprot:545917-Pelagomonas_calceolata.AAC.7